jgi:hypothetical protein
LSVYSELLHFALDEEAELRPLSELIGQVLSRRSDLGAHSSPPADPALTVGSSLAYDAALVALCRRLGVAETITEGAPVAVARPQAERLLAVRLPSMQHILDAP